MKGQVPVLALIASQVIDGTGAAAYGPGTLLIEDDLIVDVGPSESVQIPGGAHEVRLDDATVLPGLIDAHTHFGLSFHQGISQGSNYDILLQSVMFAQRCLQGGVTTVRTLSERDYLDVAYRRAIKEGWIEGPRAYIATRGLQPPHSHVSVSDVHVSGTEEVRRVVRENIAAGADVIKLYLTPPSGDATPTQSYFTFEEIRTAVEEAHRAGRRVAVHAHGGTAVDDAIAANVDTIEHGLYVTPDQFRRMAEYGTWLIGTQTIRLWPTDEASLSPPLRKAREATTRLMTSAREHNVKIAVGTDGAHGLMHFELLCLVQAGFSPVEAVQIGTKHGAEVIGIEVMTGTLEPGKWADIIAVAGDPGEDISSLQRVAFVMKGGRIYKGAQTGDH